MYVSDLKLPGISPCPEAILTANQTDWPQETLEGAGTKVHSALLWTPNVISSSHDITECYWVLKQTESGQCNEGLMTEKCEYMLESTKPWQKITHQRLVFSINAAWCLISDLLQIEPESLVSAWSLKSVYVRVSPLLLPTQKKRLWQSMVSSKLKLTWWETAWIWSRVSCVKPFSFARMLWWTCSTLLSGAPYQPCLSSVSTEIHLPHPHLYDRWQWKLHFQMLQM